MTEHSEHNPFRNNLLMQDDAIKEDEAYMEDGDEEATNQAYQGDGDDDEQRLPAADMNGQEGEEEESPEHSQNFNFVTQDLVFTAGADGHNILNFSNTGESMAVVHHREVTVDDHRTETYTESRTDVQDRREMVVVDSENKSDEEAEEIQM